MTTNIEVIVVGGGYAGVMAANRLTKRDDVNVTLINPHPAFVERIRLHQLVGGSHPAVVDYRRLLAGPVRLVVDAVTRIDPAGRRVVLAGGGVLRYDYLGYAVGSVSTDSGVPGATRFAHPLAGLQDAQRLLAIDAAEATVVGAGPLGIETAAELAEAGRAVTLVCGDVLGPYLHPRGRRSVAARLARLGVSVLEGVRATAVTQDAVQLSDGRALPNTLTIWAAGFAAPDLAARSGLSTDGLGRLRTDETLTSLDDERIVAAGDSAALPGPAVRMSCQAAVQLGPQAAETVLSRIAGRRPAAVDVGFVGECISLGRRAGIFQFARRDDSAVGRYLGGRAGAAVKELVCRGTVWQLAYEGRHPGAVNGWFKDARRRQWAAGEPALDRSAR